MTDKTNVITVTQDNLEWINENVPGSSKQKRLEEMLRVYKMMQKVCVYDGQSNLNAVSTVKSCLAALLGKKIKVYIIEVEP